MHLRYSIGFLIILVFCYNIEASPKAFALVVGNNSPPAGSNLPMLQYSDDDAVRYYRFFKRFIDNMTFG